VLDEGQPVVGTEVTLTSSQPAFPDSSVLPVGTRSSSLTNQDGNAEFLINPLGNEPFDRTDFQALTSVGEKEFACQSTVTAGLGTMFQPYVARVPEITETLALVREVQEELFAGNPEDGPEIDAAKLKQQLLELLQREPWLRARLLAYRPLLQDYVNDNSIDLNEQMLLDLNDTLWVVGERGGSEVKKAAEYLAASLSPLLFLARADVGTGPGWKDPSLIAGSDATTVFARLPLSFEENIGQAHPSADYVSRGPGYGLFISAQEAVIVRGDPGRLGSAERALHMALVGAQVAARATGEEPLPGPQSLSDWQRRWHRDVRHWSKVGYKQVYPGIDIVYYGNRRRLEFDFIAAPGADQDASG